MVRILIIKTSSLGDIIHCLPVVNDIKYFVPESSIDWLVEESFAEIFMALIKPLFERQLLLISTNTHILYQNKFML